MDVLRSRILLRPGDLDRSRRFYRDVMAWPFTGSSARRAIPGWCSSSARGLLEVSGHAVGSPGRSVMIWIQVRDIHAAHARLAAAAVRIIRDPATEP